MSDAAPRTDEPRPDARTDERPFAALRLLASIGRLHIVAIACLGTFTFGWAFTGRRLWLLSAVCALDWFLVNLLNRVVDHREDQANAIAGTDFVARHHGAFKLCGLLALLLSLPAVHLILPAITPFRVAGHALGLAYNWPLFPRGRRIKQLYFWKNVASAAGFMVTVFAYPLAWAWREGVALARGVSVSTIAVAGLFFFLFEISYEIIYDLRDAPGDRLAGVRTYPAVHGPRVAARIVDALVVCSAATLLAGYALGVVPWHLLVFVVAPVVQLVAYKRALRRGITSGDCVRLTWIGAGLLALYHVPIVLRLPVGLP